jgi:hypothetical protein
MIKNGETPLAPLAELVDASLSTPPGMKRLINDVSFS